MRGDGVGCRGCWLGWVRQWVSECADYRSVFLRHRPLIRCPPFPPGRVPCEPSLTRAHAGIPPGGRGRGELGCGGSWDVRPQETVFLRAGQALKVETVGKCRLNSFFSLLFFTQIARAPFIRTVLTCFIASLKKKQGVSFWKKLSNQF